MSKATGPARAAITDLYVLNISNPAAPTVAGFWSDSYLYPRRVAVSNGVAYVRQSYWPSGGEREEILLLDVSTGWPQLITRYDVPSEYYLQRYVSAFGSLACYPIIGGFEIIDASNPTAPVRRGGYNSGAHQPRDVQVSGNFAFVSDSCDMFQVFDVSDPRSPVRVGSYGTPTLNGGGFLRLYGNVAYVSARIGIGGDPFSLWALDISNPATPVLLRSYPVDHPYLPLYPRAISGNLGFFGLSEYLCIYDVSDPLALRLLSSYDIDIGDPNLPVFVYAVAVEGSRAYVASGGRGLHILDVANPSAPRLLATYNPGSVGSVAVRNNLAYLSTNRGDAWPGIPHLEIVDFSVPSSPRFLSVTAISGGSAERLRTYSVTLAGELLYLSEWSWRETGLKVFDISNPSRPREKGSYPLYGLVSVVGNTVYVAGQEYGLWILRYVPPLAARPSWQMYK